MKASVKASCLPHETVECPTSTHCQAPAPDWGPRKHCLWGLEGQAPQATELHSQTKSWDPATPGLPRREGEGLALPGSGFSAARGACRPSLQRRNPRQSHEAAKHAAGRWGEQISQSRPQSWAQARKCLLLDGDKPVTTLLLFWRARGPAPARRTPTSSQWASLRFKRPGLWEF